ncbi:MAG TPA: lamin tail domain-containing protein [Polyangiaceae bacterium]|jgi:hypothetical protein
MLRRALLAFLLLGAVGCGGAHKPDDTGGSDDPSLVPTLPDPMEASTFDDDSGALDPAQRPNDGGVSEGGHVEPSDAGSAANCVGPLAAGDVKIVEIMIASQSGSGDRGEWVELQSTRACILDINGLTVSSPRGTSTDSATVATDVYIQPGGSFVVADSSVSTDNHTLPNATLVATWNTYDVLKNTGDEIDVMSGSVAIDTLTYPQFTLTPGRSIAFPADCTWTDRASWSRWSMSFNVWDSPFEGTPGADNTDVSCY